MRFALDTFPHELSPAELLWMATSGAASALGIAAACGTLEAGKRADFQVVGNVGAETDKLLERAIAEGSIQEVYAAGVRYAGTVGQI
jgi:imidazolonepropionase-like amidohydrolase